VTEAPPCPVDLDHAFAALADPVRRRTIEALSEGPQAAGALARRLSVTPAVMSKHLRTLKAAGLVEDRHPHFDARVRIYALRREPIAALRVWVDDADRLWTRQLAAFKAHVEDDLP
jgi:DNA-binding transcriptional ArsR family regulator